MSVAMQAGGRMEMGGCAAELLEGELQLQSLPCTAPWPEQALTGGDVAAD